ncbi:MAG: lysophospholipid acyltransferase family protein [Candidatus Paceibacterota bacterium]|jgi:1-acyl-sn-glycerol-3-phosphate acyltransferase
MTGAEKIVRLIEKAIIWFLFRIYGKEEIEKIPNTGPLIIVFNHISMVETLIMHSLLGQRRVIALVKAEAWRNPILSVYLNMFGAIPIRRGESDLKAMRKCIEVLKGDGILAIAPEGTRSHDGQLGKGHSGVVVIAQKGKSPILPMAFYGVENVWKNMVMFCRTPFHIAVGKPFYLPEGDRKGLTDAIMYKIAELLPPRYRGRYSGTLL